MGGGDGWMDGWVDGEMEKVSFGGKVAVYIVFRAR